MNPAPFCPTGESRGSTDRRTGMNTCIERAKEIARGISSGATWVDAQMADEIAALLKTLATTVEAQAENITCVEFALNFYSEPELYHDPVVPMGIHLDGGLRARTALGLLRRARNPRTARPLTGDKS